MSRLYSQGLGKASFVTFFLYYFCSLKSHLTVLLWIFLPKFSSHLNNKSELIVFQQSLNILIFHLESFPKRDFHQLLPCLCVLKQRINSNKWYTINLNKPYQLKNISQKFKFICSKMQPLLLSDGDPRNTLQQVKIFKTNLISPITLRNLYLSEEI